MKKYQSYLLQLPAFFILLLATLFLLPNFSWAEYSINVPQPAQVKRPRIGLVLGGGSARGLAHIGVMKVLEKERIPIDCIVGTSMGALVGGAIAAGRNATELEELAINSDWSEILFSKLPRDKLSYRQKQDDRLGLAQFEIGLSDEKELLLPKAAVPTQKIALFLRNLTLGAVPINGFDALSIPYRAIAADIETGSMVILDHGDLVTAMSASMAIPGIFPPVNINNKLLVDGGIVRNLPVDVARNSCADVVIAVNVGVAPLPKNKINSLLSTARQLTHLLVASNVQLQLDSLTTKDILIEPQLDNMHATEFNRSQEFIQKGEKAAQLKIAQLKPYSLSEHAYEAWQSARYKKRPQAQKIDEVTVQVAENSKINPLLLKQRLGVKPGDILDTRAFEKRVEQVYAATDLERLGYELIYSDHGTRLNVLPIEKSWGPNYLSFGLGLRTDLNGNSGFSLSTLYRRTWINRLGGEWKLLMQFGERRQIYTEFYQPLLQEAWLYFAPYAYFYAQTWPIYQSNHTFAKLNTSRATLGLDIGSSISRFGEIRIGVNINRYSESTESFQKQFSPSDKTSADMGLRGHLYYDQMDNIYFPSSGSYVHLSAYHSMYAFSHHKTPYSTLNAQAKKAFRIAKLRILGSVEAAFATHRAPLSEYSVLGGLLNLSGYQYKELVGQGKALATLQFYYPIGFLFHLSDRANYIGMSLEAGRIYGAAIPFKEPGKYSYSLYWATDTPLGPFYVAYARGDNKKSRIYLILGKNF